MVPRAYRRGSLPDRRHRCPIVDTWWQTETGAILITPLPGITATKPGSATQPFPGIRAAILDEAGAEITPIQGALGYIACANGEDAPATGPEVGGYLAITTPWPSMMRGIWGDPQRYVDTYWKRFPGRYFPGDGSKVDADGYFWLLGRVDDIMLVAGHNISTMEVESALVDHPAVAEAAVIGKTHDIKGQAISAFVIVRAGYPGDASRLVDELKAHVAEKIGAIARPDDVILTAELPKTRSGKIMRRLLRDVAEGRALGDTTTLADPAGPSPTRPSSAPCATSTNRARADHSRPPAAPAGASREVDIPGGVFARASRPAPVYAGASAWARGVRWWWW